jgi:hypothetical protein
VKKRDIISVVLALLSLIAFTAISLPAFANDAVVTSLVVTKTASGHWDRYLNWTVDKEATPELVNLFVGDEQEIAYAVTVKQVGYTDVYRVTGQITIENDQSDTDDKTAYIDYVDDAIEARVGGTWAEVTRVHIRNPFTIPTDGTVQVPYDVEFTPPAGATSYRNVAHVGLTNHAPPPGVFKDFIYRADFSLPGTPTLHNECVDVNDSYAGYLGKVCGEGAEQTFTYERTVSYDTPGTRYIKNTTTANGQEASADVTVKVYALKVSKDASTSFNRYYTWTIDKWADQSALTLATGEQFLVNYKVTVDATYEDKDFAVKGQIYVYNPAPIAAPLNGVEDLLPGATDLNVDCDVTFPYVLGAGDTLTCDYSAGLPDAAKRVNTAKVALQNHAYDAARNATPIGTTYFQGTADVVFGSTPTKEFDESIDVSDTQYGPLGTVNASQAPKTFTYSMYVGPYDACGTYTFQNVASFVTNDNGAEGSDSWAIAVDVPCAGCTLTQGYWKTHSKYGPAPYDPTWDRKAGGDAEFLNTGYSYYEILWMNPRGGNAYLILAHQYIAAEMNVLNGAYIPAEVLDAWNQAEELLVQYEDDLSIPKRGPDRALAVQLYELLDDYNNGLIGPGHCSE